MTPHLGTVTAQPGSNVLTLISNAVFHYFQFKACQRWLALLCLALTVFATSAEAAHLHANGAIARDGSPCMLCISVHSTAPSAPVFAQPVMLAVESISAPVDNEIPINVFRLSLFIRPPPVL